MSAGKAPNPVRGYLSQVVANLIGVLELVLGWLERAEGTAEQKLSRRLRDQAARDPQDLTRRISWIINIRWMVTLVVPALVFVLSKQPGIVQAERQASGLAEMAPNLVLAGVNLALNILYAALVRRGRSLKGIAYSQIVLDILIFSLTVYSTGGVASPFTFVYFLPILTATLLLSFSAGLLCALAASLLYTGLLVAQHYGVLPVHAVFAPLAELSRGRVGYATLMGTVAVYSFFLVALLSGLLAEVVKKREQQLRVANYDLEKRMGELSMLFDVASLTNRTHQLDRVLRSILDLLVQRLSFDRVLLYLVTPDGKALKLKMLARHPRYKGMPPESYTVTFQLKKTAGLTARAAVERKMYNITDPMNSPYINRELAAKIGLNPFAVAPMLARGRLVGVLGVDHKYSGGAISEAEARSLMIFASQAAQTIENARLVSARRPQ